jgi:hypothetical protein
MKIYLDDRRPCPPGWTLVQTADEAITLLRVLQTLPNEGFDDEFEAISLDHDLGGGNDGGPAYFNYTTNKLHDRPGTGMDVLDWMLENAFLPRDIFFHSANGPARENMISKYNSWVRVFRPAEKEIPL